MNLRLYLCAIAAALSLDVEAAWAQLSGHGGPVRALAISADGKSVLSGSFDTSAIRWSLATDSAEQVLRFHSDAVNAVVFLQDGRMATAGADARIAIWTAGRQQPDEIFEGDRARRRNRSGRCRWESSLSDRGGEGGRRGSGRSDAGCRAGDVSRRDVDRGGRHRRRRSAHRSQGAKRASNARRSRFAGVVRGILAR